MKPQITVNLDNDAFQGSIHAGVAAFLESDGDVDGFDPSPAPAERPADMNPAPRALYVAISIGLAVEFIACVAFSLAYLLS